MQSDLPVGIGIENRVNMFPEYNEKFGGTYEKEIAPGIKKKGMYYVTSDGQKFIIPERAYEAQAKIDASKAAKAGPGQEAKALKQAEAAMKGLNPKKSAYFQQLQAEGTRTGPSAFAQLQTQKLAQARAQQQDLGAAQAASGAQRGFDQLAASGGVGRGALMRLQKQGAYGALMAGQQAAQQEAAGQLDVAAADEQARKDALAKAYEMKNAYQQAKANFAQEKYIGAASQSAANQAALGTLYT